MGLVAGTGGVCCTCAQVTATGCACAGGVPCSLTCRSKAADATLCGFPEFTDPSDPIRLYRRRAKTGDETLNVFSEPENCISSMGTILTVWDAWCQYNKDTCDATSGNSSYHQEFGGPTSTPGYSCSPSAVPLGTLAKTLATFDYGDGTCIDFGGIISSSYRSIRKTGTVAEELSDEDTEADAENRATAGITDWTGCGSCSVSCSAFRTDRSGGSDTFFGFRKVQTAVQWVATIGRTYNVRINFARRLLGSSGPFLDLGAPFEIAITADQTPEATDWVDVPSEAGWETIASSCEVTIQP